MIPWVTLYAAGRSYKCYLRWSHYKHRLHGQPVLPAETEACASVTSAFLQARFHPNHLGFRRGPTAPTALAGFRTAACVHVSKECKPRGVSTWKWRLLCLRTKQECVVT